MSRSLCSRVLSIALTLWMSLFMGESEWIMRCPAHDGASHSVAGASHAPAVVGTQADGAEHDHGSADHSSAPSDGPGHSCSCPGPGCCPPAIAAVPQREMDLARLVAVHEAIATSTLELFAETSEYLHPPATAPPAAGLAPLA